MERHVFRLAVRRCLLCFAAGFAATAMAGTPGLPFSEDFSDATLKDSTLTNANWSTEEQALVLAWRREQYGGFYDGSTVVGSNISDDADYTRALALGDVDGDGDLDLVVGNAGSDTATPSTFQANHLYLNNGTNAPFASVVAITIAPPDLHHTLAVALGDVDGDGDLDMIAGNSDSRNRLYFNDGSGGFDAGHDITADSFGTFALALGDLDGDGDLDLVVGNFGQANRIYLNDGSGDPWGSLGSGSAIPGSNQYTYSLALGDVDGDSDLDLVAGNYNNQVNRLYRNDGSGGFASASNITPDAETTTSMVLGDIDGDGDLDLIVGNQNQANRIYLNDGVGDPWDSLASGTAIPNSNDNTLYLALADVDGDGDLDLIGGHSNSQQNRLFFNDGLGGFATSAPLSTDSQNTYALAIGDMDGDGDLDMVAGNFDEPNRLYLNTSNASPWNGVSGSDIPDSSQGTNALALGDVDGDGDLDLVNGNMSTNRLYRNDGNGDFSDNSLVTNDSQFTLALLMADVDGDGDFDLVAGNGPGEFSRVYLNNDGLGGSWTDSDLPGSDSLNTRTLALGDVDGDGDPDLVLGNYQQTNRLYRNDGNGGFIADGNITADAHATFALQMADVDGDGDLDLIAGNGGINFSRVYLNDDGLGGSWISSSLSGSDSLNTASLALGDVDGDGDPDLMLGVREQTNRLYRNNGSGGFSAAGSIGSPTDKTYVLSLIDVDGDGDLDLITGNVTQANRLYLNNGSNDPFANVNAINISTDTQYTYALMVGDVDGDGDPDLIAGNDNGQPDRLYLNRGIPDPWGGVSSSTLSGGTGGDVVVLGDVDRDGDIDLIAGNGNSTSKRLYLNNGSIDPWSGVSPVTVGGDTYKVTSLALGDVDGDGDLDLLAGHDETTAGRHNRYYLNNGGQGAGWLGFASGAEIGSEADQTYALALGDVDRDGDLDVIAGNLSASDRLYLGDGSATPWSAASTAIDLPGVARSTRALALGDVDHDGDLDLLAGNQGQLNRVYLNDRSVNVFGSASDIGSDTDTTTAVALGDVDHDGDLDVIAGNYGQPNRLYKNDGSGVFGDVSDLDTLAGDTWSLALGDIDADGFLDLLVGNNGPDRLQVNQGGIGAGWNGFDDDALSSVGGLTGSMAVADVDGDGAADVIASNRLYQRRLFHTALNQGASLRVDDGSAPDIVGVVLSADSMAPPTTGVDYWLSNNGGAQWFQAPLDRAFFFPTIGADLRWKAALHSSSPALTPLIDNIRIVDVLIFSDGFED